MNREKFEEMVARAVETLPEEFIDRLENVVVMVADHPTHSQLKKTGVTPGNTLLGLYEGIPLSRRGNHYNLTPPDRITIFQKPIESICRNEEEITIEVQKVVQHEIAHHFGITDTRLIQIEKEKSERKSTNI
jgi:predicted Zn-dependent protease with MMP-like domain